MTLSDADRTARQLAARVGVVSLVALGCQSTPSAAVGGVAIAAPPVASRAACARCHDEIVREWEASPHRGAFSDVWFQSGYRVDHRAFCRDCHAPLNTGVDPRQWMQKTADELRASGATQTCADCHMSALGEHRAHSFAILAEPSRIADAIVVEGGATSRGAEIEVEVRLSARGASHAVPTGDVFRALELSVWTATARAQKRLLMRRFGSTLTFTPTRGISGGIGEIEDSRVPAHGVRVERFVVAGRAPLVHYRLDYLRVNPAQAAVQGIDDAANRIPLLEGAFVTDAIEVFAP